MCDTLELTGKRGLPQPPAKKWRDDEPGFFDSVDVLLKNAEENANLTPGYLTHVSFHRKPTKIWVTETLFAKYKRRFEKTECASMKKFMNAVV